jgi:hypothetical protein
MSETNMGASALRLGLILMGAVLLFALDRPAQAQRLALPPDEQNAVNRAIDRGVEYLKQTQLGNGSWTMPKKPHEVGYAVLPGLTLLECGVPPSDKVIQRTVRFLRSRAPDLHTTYELSLGILFLDRLNSGDPKDKKIIQTFALRLIAGQSTTGGWGYKCPGMKELPARMQMDLLAALRHLDPPPADGLPLLAGNPGNQPGIAGKPGDLPAIAKNPGKMPNDLNPLAQLLGGPLMEGVAREPGTPLSGTPTTGDGGSRYTPPPELGEPSLFREWLGFSNSASALDLPAPPEKKDPNDKDKDGKRGAEKADGGKGRKGKPEDGKGGDDKKVDVKPLPKPPKPYVLPDHLNVFTVIQDPDLHMMQEPNDKRNDLIVTTTDNSNTQFAILALWAAQRHGIPMKRSLNLIVRGFVTSQNGDGSWGYDYRFGGGIAERPPMTCVGLIGLAVGHGLANRAAGKPVQDPRVLNGFVALSKHIGRPIEVPAILPMQNLYFLWSVERVAVLYNLPTIGDKDWYRWGAQILVANQDRQGNWANGQYHGNSPTLDTCLALLFLKRANLVKDLTAILPINPADLNNSVMEKLAPPPAPKQQTTPIEMTTALPEAPKTAEPDNPISKPLADLSGTTATRTPEPDPTSESVGGGKKKWIALSVVLFVLLTGGSLFFFLVVVKRNKDEEEDKHAHKKLKGSKGKRKSKTMASPQSSKD